MLRPCFTAHGCPVRLQARLLVVLQEQNAARLAEIRGDLVKAEWGQQIRNYVVHPYRLVKDTRTGERREGGRAWLADLRKHV